MRGSKTPRLLLLLTAVPLLACPSAYDQAYQQETQKLEAQQQAEQARQRAEHAEAQKYAAVVYFEAGSEVIQEDDYRDSPPRDAEQRQGGSELLLPDVREELPDGCREATHPLPPTLNTSPDATRSFDLPGWRLDHELAFLQA